MTTNDPRTGDQPIDPGDEREEGADRPAGLPDGVDEIVEPDGSGVSGGSSGGSGGGSGMPGHPDAAR